MIPPSTTWHLGLDLGQRRDFSALATMSCEWTIEGRDPVSWEWIRVPKLIVHGEADPMLPVRFARRLYDAAADPKELAVIAGAGHEDAADVNAAAYFAALNGFLRKYHLSPRGRDARR